MCGEVVGHAEFTAEVDGDLQREDLAKIITCSKCRKLVPFGRYVCGVVEVREACSSAVTEREGVAFKSNDCLQRNPLISKVVE